MKKNQKIEIFCQNGTMELSLTALLLKAGLNFSRQKGSRVVTTPVVDSDTFGQISFFRPHDVAELIYSAKKMAGIRHPVIGFTGLDMYIRWLLREGLKLDTLQIAAVLPICGSTNERAATIVVCENPPDGNIDIDNEPGVIDEKSIRVYTEYLGLAKILFPSSVIIDSEGSSENKIARGFGRYAIVVRDSGTSIRLNQLTVAQTLFTTPIVMLASDITPEIETFGERLMGVLHAQAHVTVKMHVLEQQVQAAADVIKNFSACMLGPTMSNVLSDEPDKYMALEVTTLKSRAQELQTALKKIGASAFVETQPSSIGFVDLKSRIEAIKKDVAWLKI